LRDGNQRFSPAKPGTVSETSIIFDNSRKTVSEGAPTDSAAELEDYMAAQFLSMMDTATIGITIAGACTALLVLRTLFGAALARELAEEERCRHCH
jgi:hypothetical protein